MRKQRSTNAIRIAPIICYMLLGACLQKIFLMAYSKATSSSASSISLRERLRSPGDDWTLVVTLTFTSKDDQQQILEEWRPLAKHCADHEPFLHHYEAGLSDSDPLKVHMVERYESKEHYLNTHKSGKEFLKFRPKLAALQEAGKVKIEGFSYQELGYGFV